MSKLHAVSGVHCSWDVRGVHVREDVQNTALGSAITKQQDQAAAAFVPQQQPTGLLQLP